MRIIFAGTPAFALPTLRQLHTAGHSIVAVYTQPDRPAGRGRKNRSSPVKEYAASNQLPLYQPVTLRGEEHQLSRLEADLMIVVAYGLILPPSVLSIPRLGCLNVHASLLPRWRGAAPVARAIEAGDNETGVTIMQMEAGLDTGPMLLQQSTPILETDTAALLEERLALLGAQALLVVLEDMARYSPQPQDSTKATYAGKLQKSEAILDWAQPAVTLHRKVRALNPTPVAHTSWRGEVLRIWDVGSLMPAGALASAAPGTVLSADARGLWVATGDGVLNLQRLQAPGGKVLSARDFLNGTPVVVGDRFN